MLNGEASRLRRIVATIVFLVLDVGCSLGLWGFISTAGTNSFIKSLMSDPTDPLWGTVRGLWLFCLGSAAFLVAFFCVTFVIPMVIARSYFPSPEYSQEEDEKRRKTAEQVERAEQSFRAWQDERDFREGKYNGP